METVCFFIGFLNWQNEKKVYSLSINTKDVYSNVLTIPAISPVVHTRDMYDIFNTFDENIFEPVSVKTGFNDMDMKIKLTALRERIILFDRFLKI